MWSAARKAAPNRAFGYSIATSSNDTTTGVGRGGSIGSLQILGGDARHRRQQRLRVRMLRSAKTLATVPVSTMSP
jgi:hypothetical protein